MEKNKNSFPDKKDFWYSISILVLIISGLTAFYFGGEGSNMVSHVGFAGTIVSILLAVIAIIYSFYQSSTYENANYKLDTSAQKIEDATNQLSNVSEIEEIMKDFKSDVITIKDSIDDMKGIVGKVDDGFSSFKREFEEIYIEVNPSSKTGNAEKLSEVFTENYFQQFFEKIAELNMYVFIVLINAYKNGKEIDMKSCLLYYFEHKRKAISADTMINHFLDTKMGELIAFEQAGFFNLQVKYVYYTLKVSKINANFLKAVEEIESDVLQHNLGDQEFQKVIQGFKNNVHIFNVKNNK